MTSDAGRSTPIDVIDGELVEDGVWDLAHRVHALDVTFAAMNGQVQASVHQLGDEYVHGWVALWVRWRRFSEAPPQSPTLERQVREYERSVVQWRQAARSRGVVALELPSPPPSRLRRAGARASGELGDGELGDDEDDGWAATAAIATAITATAVAVVAVVNKLSS